LEPGACVFDVGANIGMFSLFIHHNVADVHVYAFEPIPPIFDVLSLNAALYGNDIKVFPYGISSREEKGIFTYYPHASVLSGCYADNTHERKTVKAFIYNEQSADEKAEGLSDSQVNELLEDRLVTTQFTCHMKPLSRVIRETGVDRVDLLKIDVEKCEIDVLDSIDEADWARIRQMVIEVHDIDGRLKWIKEKLDRQGYRVVVEQDSRLRNTDLYNIYGVLPQQRKVPASKENYPPMKSNARWCGSTRLISDLRTFLKKHLPDYMVPSTVVLLDKMPLTPNGKIDRRELPEPGSVESKHDSPGPGNEREEKLTAIWSDILGIEKNAIGIRTNFFESGGHSLKATVLRTRIHKVFNVKMPMSEIFQRPTIKEMADYIEGAAKDNYTSIRLVETKDYYALSSAQQRLYIIQQMEAGHIGYNMPGVVVLKVALEIEKLENVFRQLIERHESLRTSFHIIDSHPVQRVHESVEFDIRYYQSSVHGKSPGGTRGLAPLTIEPTAGNRQRETSLIKNFIRPFDLSRAPLLRVGLIKTGEEKHILMIDMHHIISDGASLEIFIQEFMAFYGGEDLPPVKIQYKDYAEWQNRQKGNEEIKKQERFWQKEFSGPIPLLNLPADYERPPGKYFDGNTLEFEIDPEAVRALNTMAVEEGTTRFVVLLALYTVMLWKLTGQEDIVVGTPVAGRQHADLQHTIGIFLNMLPLRNFPGGEKTFKGFLAEVGERTLEAFENQEYPFEDLVEKVTKTRDINRNPLFDAAFTLENIDRSKIEMPGLILEQYDYENTISKFDMTLTATEGENTLRFAMTYSTKLFKIETIEGFINCFKEVLSAVVKNKEVGLQDIRVAYGLSDTNGDIPQIDFKF
jgi:FkbM family methyltransferase